MYLPYFSDLYRSYAALFCKIASFYKDFAATLRTTINAVGMILTLTQEISSFESILILHLAT